MGLDCPVRIVSFAMRAILAKSESAGEKFNLVLSQQIIYGVGFFGIPLLCVLNGPRSVRSSHR